PRASTVVAPSRHDALAASSSSLKPPPRRSSAASSPCHRSHRGLLAGPQTSIGRHTARTITQPPANSATADTPPAKRTTPKMNQLWYQLSLPNGNPSYLSLSTHSLEQERRKEMNTVDTSFSGRRTNARNFLLFAISTWC
ncbi:hypothetical protein ZWY2020_018935, partial [Hordeum vulgare]